MKPDEDEKKVPGVHGLLAGVAQHRRRRGPSEHEPGDQERGANAAQYVGHGATGVELTGLRVPARLQPTRDEDPAIPRCLRKAARVAPLERGGIRAPVAGELRFEIDEIGERHRSSWQNIPTPLHTALREMGRLTTASSPGYTAHMGGSGLFAGALTLPWCRALAIIGVWLFAANTLGLSRLTAPGPASCCCGHHTGDAKCHCRACTHARELASNKPLVKTCGFTGDMPSVVSPEPAYAHAVLRPGRVVTPPRLEIVLLESPAPSDPFFEVPTPPPLSRS